MKSRMSSKFSQIPHPTAELAALERVKNPHRLTMGKTMSPLFLFEDMHKSLDEFEFGQDLKTNCRISGSLSV